MQALDAGTSAPKCEGHSVIMIAAASAILSPKNKKELLANILKSYETNGREVSTNVKHVELRHQHIKLCWAYIFQIFNRRGYLIVKNINVLTQWLNMLVVKYPHRLNILNFVLKCQSCLATYHPNV